MTRISIPALRRALDRRQLREADIDHGLYVAPRGARGEHIVEYPIGSGNQVHVGSALQGQTFAPGTVVPLGSHTGDSRRLIIGGPPSGRRGVSQFPVDAPPPGQLDSVGIISASPATVESGAAGEAATLTGYGFRTTDTFEAVRQTSSGWEVDPLVTVATVSIDDSETAQITLTVSASTPAGYAISFRPVGRAAVGPHLVQVIEASAPDAAYWGIYYDPSGEVLHCWLYNAAGEFVEVVDTQAADLTGTRNAPSWGAYCVPMELSGDVIEWPYSIDVSPFTRSGFRWLPLSGTLAQYGSTIDPASETASDWYGRHSGVRIGDRFYLSQLSTFLTSGRLTWTDVTNGASLRGMKTIDFSSHGLASGELAFDTGFAAGWVPVGNLILMEVNDSGTRGLMVVNADTKATTMHTPHTSVGPYHGTNSLANWSPGIDMGDGSGVLLKRLATFGWVAVIRSSDGSPDVQHWQDDGLTHSLTRPPKVSRVPGTSEIVAYPFTTGKLVRTDTADGANVNTTSSTITVEVGPNGQLPHVMLPRS